MSANQGTAIDSSNIAATVPKALARQPIVWWSATGIVFVALQAYILLLWLSSPDFSTVGSGIDVVPAQVKSSAWISQFNALALFLGCVIYCVRKSWREERLTWDALLVIGGLSVCWLDTAINYFHPIVLYNAYMFNLGSWSSHIPGWASTAKSTPEPLLFVVGLYGWWFLLFSMAFCAIAHRLKRRWPQVGLGGLILAGIAALSVLDAVLELAFVFSGLYVYAAVIPDWTLWLGTAHQFPLYGALILGVLCTVVAMLRYDAGERQYSFVERGADILPVSVKMRTLIRVLAIIGFMNAVFVTAVAVHWWIGLYAEQSTFIVPSYLSSGSIGVKIP